MRFFIFTLLFVAQQAFASAAILISDIDDTVRQTNVHNLGSLTILKNNEFAGMAKLYNELRKTFSEVDYVTGNPIQLKGTVDFFLSWNEFPVGKIFARDTKTDTVTHKVAAISEIINSKNPEVVIMFGDNGEQDPVTHAKISEKFPGRTQSFIHQIYDTEVPADQTVWLTSIDLSATLFSKGILSSESFDSVLDFTLPKLFSNRSDREKVLPSWGECRTFFKNYARPAASFSASQADKLNKYETFLRDRCS